MCFAEYINTSNCWTINSRKFWFY